MLNRLGARLWIFGIISIVVPLFSVSLFTNFTGFADEGPPSCSMECTLIVKQVKDKETSEDWSFILLQEVNGEKTYHQLPFIPSNGQESKDDIKTVDIQEAKNLVEGNHYELYESNYSGEKEVTVGLLVVKRDSSGSSVAGYNSKKLTFDCKDIYPEKPGGLQMLGKDEFKVTVNGSENQGETKASWKVSLITHQSAYNPGTKRAEGIINLAGVSLWLGLTTYLILGQ